MHHSPYRIAAPPVKDAPDQVDAYEALLRARAKRGRRLITATCGIVAGLSMLALAEAPPTARAETSEMKAANRIIDARIKIRAAEDKVRQDQIRFSNAVHAAMEDDAIRGVAARRKSEPCGVEWTASNHLLPGRSFSLLTVASNARELPSPSVASALVDIHGARDQLNNGQYVDGMAHAELLDSTIAKYFRYDAVVVTTSMKYAIQTSESKFEPGEVNGLVYLYDFIARRVVCTGEIHATNSKQIEYTYAPRELGVLTPAGFDRDRRLSEFLEADMELQVQRSITAGVLFKVD